MPISTISHYSKISHEKNTYYYKDGKLITEDAEFALSGEYAIEALPAYVSEELVNTDGVVRHASDLYCGDFLFTEEEAPIGYRPISAPVAIKVSENRITVTGHDAEIEKDGNTWIVRIINRSMIPTPTNYKDSMVPYAVVGFTGLFLLAVWLLMERRKRR